MKPNIWIFSIEPIQTRYTQQWHEHFPKLLATHFKDHYNVIQIDGEQKNTVPTPGAFLNFSDTNYWKSSQLTKFLDHYNNGETTTQDHFIFTDAWNPTVLQLKYMKDLLGLNWTIHGLWHAGSHDSQDFLGRIIGDQPWVRHTEQGMFHAFDHNYFATEFHINLFSDTFSETEDDEWKLTMIEQQKIVQTGWPMEYMNNILTMYKGMPKRDLILFPHRIAPEKQVEIFRDLKEQLPQYDFVVCQYQQLTKNEYHNLLGEAKIVFSANLQETLGISCFEGSVVDAIPMVPDRLSYTEMYEDKFKYPSDWTLSWDHYITNRKQLCDHIVKTMDNYSNLVPNIQSQAYTLREKFFSCHKLLSTISNSKTRK